MDMRRGQTMTSLNKKLSKVVGGLKRDKLNKLHNTNKDLKYWTSLEIADENDKLETVYCLDQEGMRQYEIDVHNSMKIPVKGRGYGKK